jgi:hypothetical protein
MADAIDQWVLKAQETFNFPGFPGRNRWLWIGEGYVPELRDGSADSAKVQLQRARIMARRAKEKP